MTRAQRAWASEHDWFIREHKDVQDYCNNDSKDPVSVYFDDYKKLREWAGY